MIGSVFPTSPLLTGFIKTTSQASDIMTPSRENATFCLPTLCYYVANHTGCLLAVPRLSESDIGYNIPYWLFLLISTSRIENIDSQKPLNTLLTIMRFV